MKFFIKPLRFSLGVFLGFSSSIVLANEIPPLESPLKPETPTVFFPFSPNTISDGGGYASYSNIDIDNSQGSFGTAIDSSSDFYITWASDLIFDDLVTDHLLGDVNSVQASPINFYSRQFSDDDFSNSVFSPFVQVVDNTRSGVGWELHMKLDEFVADKVRENDDKVSEDDEYYHLAGAFLSVNPFTTTIMSPACNPMSEDDDQLPAGYNCVTNNLYKMPYIPGYSNVINSDNPSDTFNIIPSEDIILMKADANSGYGVWTLSFNNDGSVESNGEGYPAGESETISISLNIPKSAKFNKSYQYVSNITWTLMVTPT